MAFRYRYVGFGTRFVAETGHRSSAAQPADRLYANELAVDVGGVCWGSPGVEIPVLDHHFFRSRGQFPSATAAVLHHARTLYEAFASCTGDIWLVTHRDPDFDALCALYIARCLLTDEDPIPHESWELLGLKTEGWFQTREEIDWFRPDVSGLPAHRRWPILLAAYATAVDHARRLACPKQRTLHAILYAALQRGRPYAREDSGAVEFFEEVRGVLARDDLTLNPLYDSVLEDSALFAPERALLDREIEAYRRDLQRARRSIVFVPEAPVPFADWFPTVQHTPLLTADKTIQPEHLQPAQQRYSAVDGIFIRDPECLLFKEWAREDTEHASLGQGFLFTAVAYSEGNAQATLNRTAYFFALDPERAGNRHLYPVWARLQAAEVRAAAAQDGVPRQGFEARAAGYEPFFTDPWFDGSNYRCTIVVTPHRGTAIAPPGTAADLSDDPIADQVARTLEYAVFCSPVLGCDLPINTPHPSQLPPDTPCDAQLLPALPEGTYRFGRVALEEQVNLASLATAEQIGRSLWRMLSGSAAAVQAEHVPADVLRAHLVVDSESVGVWSRRGIMLAYKQAAQEKAAQVLAHGRTLTVLANDIAALVQPPSTTVSPPPSPPAAAPPPPPPHGHASAHTHHTSPSDEGAQRAADALTQRAALMQRVLQFRHHLVQLDAPVLERFFTASGLADVLQTAYQLASVAEQQAQATQMGTHIATVAGIQQMVHWVEIFLVAVYATELFHIVGEAFHFDPRYLAWSLVGGPLLIAGTVAQAIRPWGHGGFPRRIVRAAIVLVLVFGLFLGLGSYVFKSAHPTSGPTTNHTSGAGQSPLQPEDLHH